MTFMALDPSTGHQFAELPDTTPQQVAEMVEDGHRALEVEAQWRTPLVRAQALARLARRIEAEERTLTELETRDTGKPLKQSKVDVAATVRYLEYYAGSIERLEGRQIPLGPDVLDYTLREPWGVCAQIIPWNYPLLMAAWKLAPALATGCTVVLKVAEETPLSALRLGELLLEIGLPKGVVNIVTGFGETAGAALAAHPGVDKIAFTGSTEVGRLIVRAAANDLKKVSLELGGKSPNIILKDADLDVAIPGAASAIFFNHGQCCCAGSRLYAEEPVFDRVVEGVAEAAKKIKLGPGLDPKTEMGPMVSEIQRNRVCGYLESGFAEGARAITGGGARAGAGYFVEPTVLVDTEADMKVVQEEIFGPVVTAMPFEALDDRLIERANDTIYGLAAGVWTRDLSKAHTLAARLKSGTVWVNCYNVFDAALPFGGYKQSGWGREMGEAVLEHYTETKAVTIRL
jgi:phenylacetaldehyde dehydrogenase